MGKAGQNRDLTWPSKYACLPRSAWLHRGGAYELRTIHWRDRHSIREWRNAQIDALRQSEPLTIRDQDLYFNEVVALQLEESRPSQVLLTLWHRDALVGYGGLVHINWDHQRAEVSFLADPARWDAGDYEEDFLAFLEVLEEVARDDLSLHRLTGETYPEREEHVRIFESFGFVREGRLIEHRKTEAGFGDSLVHGLLLSRGSHD